MRRGSLTPVEILSVAIAAIAALAAAVQSYLSFRQRDDFLEAILVEQASTQCAEVAALARGWGRELDAYVSGANGDLAFAGSRRAASQITRAYEARIAFDIAVERLQVLAPAELARQAEALDRGSEDLRFATDITSLTIIDNYTTGLGQRILGFRQSCRQWSGVDGPG